LMQMKGKRWQPNIWKGTNRNTMHEG